MRAKRWIATGLVMALTLAGACTGVTPVGVDDGALLEPPEAPVDTSGFVPVTTEF